MRLSVLRGREEPYVIDCIVSTVMVYDMENRLKQHTSGGSVATYLYMGTGLKRVEDGDGALTTLVWDGQDNLQERN